MNIKSFVLNLDKQTFKNIKSIKKLNTNPQKIELSKLGFFIK